MPSLDAEDDRTPERLLRHVVAVGLAQRPAATVSIDQVEFDRLFAVICSEQLCGLLVRAVHDDVITLTPDQLDRTAVRHRFDMERAVIIERAALAASRALSDRHIDHVLLKGIPLAREIYRSPEERVCGDADILVDPARFSEAIRTLVALGALRDLPEVRKGYDARFAKDVPIAFEEARR